MDATDVDRFLPKATSYPVNKVDRMTQRADPLETVADTALMLRVGKDDECAFAELYRRYHRRLLNFFYGMSRNTHFSSDLCQETFLRLWRLRRKYAATGVFVSYLFTIARLVWLEQRRERRKRLFSTPLTEEDHWLPLATKEIYRPDEAAVQTEIGRCILDALSKLPEEQRMAFVLRVVQGLDLQEIASIMQCPVNTVRSRKLLAIQKLREALQGMLVL